MIMKPYEIKKTVLKKRKNSGLKKLDISVVCNSHFHDVWIWRGDRLILRFWQGTTKNFQDETYKFKAFLDNGAKLNKKYIYERNHKHEI